MRWLLAASVLLVACSGTDGPDDRTGLKNAPDDATAETVNTWDDPCDDPPPKMAPVINSIFPNSGPPGTSLWIQGLNFPACPLTPLTYYINGAVAPSETGQWRWDGPAIPCGLMPGDVTVQVESAAGKSGIATIEVLPRTEVGIGHCEGLPPPAIFDMGFTVGDPGQKVYFEYITGGKGDYGVRADGAALSIPADAPDLNWWDPLSLIHFFDVTDVEARYANATPEFVLPGTGVVEMYSLEISDAADGPLFDESPQINYLCFWAGYSDASFAYAYSPEKQQYARILLRWRQGCAHIMMTNRSEGAQDIANWLRANFAAQTQPE